MHRVQPFHCKTSSKNVKIYVFFDDFNGGLKMYRNSVKKMYALYPFDGNMR